MSTVRKYADMLLAHFDSLRLEPATDARGWSHMGGLISDAALQRRARYKETVLPRVKDLVKAWPDANTLSGFVARLSTNDVGAVLRWRGRVKLTQIVELARAFQDLDIEIVDDLANAYATTPERTRNRLLSIHGVGSKTVDYIAILAGSVNHVAVDTHLREFAKNAGLPTLPYADLNVIIKCAAQKRGWSPGSLDAAIWRYMSKRR